MPTPTAGIFWVASPSSGVVSYKVYRGTTSGGPYALEGSPALAVILGFEESNAMPDGAGRPRRADPQCLSPLWPERSGTNPPHPNYATPLSPDLDSKKPRAAGDSWGCHREKRKLPLRAALGKHQILKKLP